MELFESIVLVWEYLVEHSAAIAGRVFGFDPKPLVPWAQLVAALLAIVATTWGLWNLWNHFDFRRRKLLAKFLADEEKRILETKTGLARRFLRTITKTDALEPLDLHATLDEAVRMFDAGKIAKAERELKHLQELLSERQAVAASQASVALKQSAAVHLFLGAISASQGSTQHAIQNFRSALQKNPDDLDSNKYLIEQYLVLSQKEPASKQAQLDQALSQIQDLQGRCGDQDEYRAEALRLKGETYLALNNRGLARAALEEGGKISEGLSHHPLVSAIFEKLGIAWGQQFHKEAGKAFGKSIASYEHLGLVDDVRRVRKLRDDLCRTTDGQDAPVIAAGIGLPASSQSTFFPISPPLTRSQK